MENSSYSCYKCLQTFNTRKNLKKHIINCKVIKQKIRDQININKQGHVYFIFQEGNDLLCKIGRSKNKEKRLKQLQTGNPSKLYIYKSINGHKEKEIELHQHFADKRIPGSEWFHLSKQDVDNFLTNYESHLPTELHFSSNSIINCETLIINNISVSESNTTSCDTSELNGNDYDGINCKKIIVNNIVLNNDDFDSSDEYDL